MKRIETANPDIRRKQVKEVIAELLKKKGDDVASVKPVLTTPLARDNLEGVAGGDPAIPVHVYKSVMHQLCTQVYPLEESPHPGDQIILNRMTALRKAAPAPDRKIYPETPDANNCIPHNLHLDPKRISQALGR